MVTSASGVLLLIRIGKRYWKHEPSLIQTEMVSLSSSQLPLPKNVAPICGIIFFRFIRSDLRNNCPKGEPCHPGLHLCWIIFHLGRTLKLLLLLENLYLKILVLHTKLNTFLLSNMSDSFRLGCHLISSHIIVTCVCRDLGRIQCNVFFKLALSLNLLCNRPL